MRYIKYLFYHVKRGMIKLQVSKEIHASLDKIWNIVSDIDREPEFWHGTKSVKNMKKDGNVVERETVIAFRNTVSKKTVILDAKNSVKKKNSQWTYYWY
ncbi:MAG TPA: SRPBCC family protein [Nitrososphaeraceae archaeon]|nr:SRPBCC family protein [Nitrososphaeraceae archaeon]